MAISLMPVLLFSVDLFCPKSSSSDGNTQSIASVLNKFLLSRVFAASKASNLDVKDVATKRLSLPKLCTVSATSPLKSQMIVKPVLAGCTIGFKVN